MRLDHVDLFFLHSNIIPDDYDADELAASADDGDYDDDAFDDDEFDDDGFDFDDE